jgi:hypothetical protein
MSFSRNNEHFLRQEFYGRLRGLAGKEKELRYVASSKTEARRRMRLYFESIKNNIQSKITFYQELIEIFGPLEKEFLLYSIYLDQHSDTINDQLGRSVMQLLDLSDHPLRLFFEQKANLHDGSFTRGFLKQYFTGELELHPGEWEAEDGKNNPVTNKLIAWLIAAVTNDHITKELQPFLLNYTKLWNIYFIRTYNINKALILIHKFYELYRHLNPEGLRIDLNNLLTNLNNFIGMLLPDVFNSPLTDVYQPSEILTDGSHRNQSSTKAYLNKISEVQERLKMDAVFFEDLSGVIWSELLVRTCKTPLPARMAYLRESDKRTDAGKPPSFVELNMFLERISEEEDDPKVYEKVIAEHYLFFF